MTNILPSAKSQEIPLIANDERLKGVQFRQPIIDGLPPRYEREWRLITEIARRSILTDPIVRKVASEFTQEPLNEALAGHAIDRLAAVDGRLSRVGKITKRTLGNFLELPAVPDELLQPDIKNAPLLRKREDVKRMLDILEGQAIRRADMMQFIGAEQSPGVSGAEKILVAERYQFARDVKLLGLMAELHDQPVDPVLVKDDVMYHKLASGTEIGITREAFAMDNDLLNPEVWKSRRQIKDRVFEVVINDKKYILKERKTNRHVDTLGRGHSDGLSSKDEFLVGLDLVKKGQAKTANIQLHWETPLGFVEFPDGYQFCLFDFEADIENEGKDARNDLESSIVKNPEFFQSEYERINREAAELYKERPDLIRRVDPASTVNKRKGFAKILGRAQQSATLSYEDFAELKAHYLLEEAQKLYSDTLVELGYQSRDSNRGKVETIRHIDDKIIIDVFGFDYEYLEKDPVQAELIRKRRAELQSDGEDPLALLDFYQSGFGQPAIKHAASFVMLRDLGQTLPSPTR